MDGSISVSQPCVAYIHTYTHTHAHTQSDAAACIRAIMLTVCSLHGCSKGTCAEVCWAVSVCESGSCVPLHACVWRCATALPPQSLLPGSRSCRQPWTPLRAAVLPSLCGADPSVGTRAHRPTETCKGTHTHQQATLDYFPSHLLAASANLPLRTMHSGSAASKKYARRVAAAWCHRKLLTFCSC